MYMHIYFEENYASSATQSTSGTTLWLDPLGRRVLPRRRSTSLMRVSFAALYKQPRRPPAPGQFHLPRLDRVGECPPKFQFQIEPGALPAGPKGSMIRSMSELGCEGFKQGVSIDWSPKISIHV